MLAFVVSMCDVFQALINSLVCWLSSVLLYVHRDRTDYQGRGAQDGHLDFHIALELWQKFPDVTVFVAG